MGSKIQGQLEDKEKTTGALDNGHEIDKIEYTVADLDEFKEDKEKKTGALDNGHEIDKIEYTEADLEEFKELPGTEETREDGDSIFKQYDRKSFIAYHVAKMQQYVSELKKGD